MNGLLSKAAHVASCAIVGLAFAAPSIAADAPKNWKAPRTLDGVPDLQGVWTSATLTRLERGDEFGNDAR